MEHKDIGRYSFGQAVLFVCATNRPEAINPELMLSGRIDRHFKLAKPGPDARVELFGVYGRNKHFEDDVDITKVRRRDFSFSNLIFLFFLVCGLYLRFRFSFSLFSHFWAYFSLLCFCAFFSLFFHVFCFFWASYTCYCQIPSFFCDNCPVSHMFLPIFSLFFVIFPVFLPSFSPEPME